MPVITAIIPVFNRAHRVGQSIESVLAQEMPAGGWSVETIIVDDGSSDDLDRALREFGTLVVRIRHDRNRGAGAARNTGIAAAGGSHVAFLDSDDVWLPGKLAAQIGFMEMHGYRASCTAYMLSRPDEPPFVSPRYATGPLRLADLAWGCFVSPGSTLVCQREAFAEIGKLDESFPRLEDWDWLMRYVRLHTLGFLAQPLARIDVAPGRDVATAFVALDRMEKKHASTLPPRERRHFKAALHLERAAVHSRSGRPFAGIAALAKSLCLAPVRNRALGAVLHNRPGRPQGIR
jgi:glycosyltransferase involved in cell wall biosynthesis